MSTTPNPAANPLRIKTLTLTDFRGFPGPEPARFDLDSRNLLVYGENGAGKSSLFYALRGFFSLKDGRRLRDYKNIFSGEADTTCKVSVEFGDGTPSVDWTSVIHPSAIGPGGSDARVTEASLRRACLDYRAILDTNYLHGSGKVNLFEVAVEHLLRDYAVTATGGTPTTIGALWDQVLRSKPSVQSTAAMARINQACLEFNTAFRGAFPILVPLIRELLDLLGYGEIEIHGFLTPGLTYRKEFYIDRRRIEGRELHPELTFRGLPLTTPQNFLNEARLSALGLAIYLAGRLACTPAAPGTALKLLVLDDVLIGLDHSNRLPVLDVLKSKFADWQIVLLTFDRVWYEMARFYLGSRDSWKCIEVFAATDVERGIPVPIIRPASDKAAEALLNQAKAFVADHHVPAAANYTRSAFELALKDFCTRHHVPVSYNADPRKISSEDLLSSVESWLSKHSARQCFGGVLEKVKLFRKVVLNPYSHSAPSNIAGGEVNGAIAAVESLLAVLRPCAADADLLLDAQALITKALVSVDETHAALGFLRAAFFLSLLKFCERKNLRLPYRAGGHDCIELWNAVIADQTRLFPAPHNTAPAQIDAERSWLISPVSSAVLAAITQTELARILAVVAPTGTNRMILDTL